MTRKDLAGTYFHTSAIFTVSTKCYAKGLYKEGFHCQATLNPLLGGKLVSLMMPHLTNLLTVKNPHTTT
jgi:hypothetical protein